MHRDSRARRHDGRLDARQDRGGGPDAAEFLNRVYVNSFSKLGSAVPLRLMLSEAGYVMDDGVSRALARTASI